MVSGRRIAVGVVGLGVILAVMLAAVASGSSGNGGGSFVCRPSPPDVTHDAPSVKLMGMLAPLRRPSAPGDAAPLDRMPLENLGGIEVDYIRLVRRLDGVRYYLVPAQRLLYPVPQSCIDQLPPRQRQIETELKQKLERHPREQIDVVPVDPPPSPTRVAQSQIFLGGAGCGVGGPSDELSKQPEFATCSAGSHPRSSLAIELVPDNVARVRVFYPRKPRGRKHPFRRAFSRTVAVRNNVALLHVPRRAIWSFPGRTTWLARDGTVVRRFREH
jgi:hypothetical protein